MALQQFMCMCVYVCVCMCMYVYVCMYEGFLASRLGVLLPPPLQYYGLVSSALVDLEHAGNKSHNI